MSAQDRLVAGRFRFIHRLGSGAMASVFLAEDCELGRRVAIKRLHPDTSDDIAPRFRREMRVAASLSHPNIVTLYDAITDDGAVLLVMEYVEGPTLAQRMADGPLDPDDAIAMLRALADAVDYLHARGVIHRDIKPANILLDRGGRVKLTDLGIASAAEATGITTSGTILGTPAYMAPELFEGERATPAADVYSIAAVAFEMLSGRRARGGGTPAVLAMRATSEPPPDLREIWPEAGPLAAVLERGMARDPRDRPESATALVEDVVRALRERNAPVATAPEPRPEPEPEPPPPPPRERERRSPVPLLAGALALAVAVIAAVLIASGGGGDGGGPAPTRSTAKRTTGTSRSNASRSTSSKTQSTSSAAQPTSSAAQPTSSAAQPTSSAAQPTSSTPPPTSSTPQPTSSTPQPSPAAAAPTSPAGAVRAFYGRAAAHRYAAAWALAAPGLRSQLGGFAAFRRQFSTARSIVFSRVQTVAQTAGAARVALATTATHTAFVDRCTGTADTAPGSGGGWLVTHLNVSCRRSASAG